MWIVRLALRRPYTFIVMAILIGIMGGLSIVTTPTDIFPYINIPMVGVIWTYNGMSPDDMAKRVLFVSERAMTTTVNNIERIEATAYNGVGLIRVYMQPGHQRRSGGRPGDGGFPDAASDHAARHFPAADRADRRLQRSHTSVGSEQRHAYRAATLRLRPEFHSYPAGNHTGHLRASALRRESPRR